MLSKISSFRANKILGGINYELKINGNVAIIVGPNGSGKSTFLNIFYLFITRQWSRLLEYGFSSLVLTSDSGEIELHKADLFNAENISKLNPRLRRYFEQLNRDGLLDLFLSKRKYTSEEQKMLAAVLDMPEVELRRFRTYIAHEVDDLFRSKLFVVERALEKLGLGRVLYLPTYRRIEKDLKSIFPDIEDRFRNKLMEGQISARQGLNFEEIISFGMDDINKMISDFTGRLNSLAKTKSNDAAQEYIRDMVRGVIKEYSIGPIREISSSVISEFVTRLDDHLLSKDDKEALVSQIDTLRTKKVGKPQKDMQYLGFFVEKMLRVYLAMKEEEQPLVDFTKMVSKYIGANKEIEYKDYVFSIRDRLTGSEIDLNMLSSGEKQIVSIFAYLLLRERHDNIVLIDEPEMSLSVPWQKTFLTDIIATGRCDYVLTVTHSPFVFDNILRSNIVDVRKLVVE